MRIGIVIGRMGGIDGVALETEKWITVLQRMGHQVSLLTGELEGEADNVSILPELSFEHPWTEAGQEMAFYGRPVKEAELFSNLEQEAAVIEQGILDWIIQQRIQCLISENATALPCHLTMGMALQRVLWQTGLPAISHDHDFYWERGDRYTTPYPAVHHVIARCFPVKLPNVRHAVINSAARQTLAQRFDIQDAVVVPNVMDFDHPFGQEDDFNEDLRDQLGLSDEDILLFQVTRIVSRKGIEVAIDLVDQLQDPRVKLIITGTSLDDYQDAYLNQLIDLVQERNLDGQVLFAGEHFGNVRSRDARGKKIYAISDAYAHAAACTYFSFYEGFGNAFVEAVAAHKPIFVNNYEPVYWPDIGSLGFKTVMIQNGKLEPRTIQQVREVLNHSDMPELMTTHNYNLGRHHFSYQALEKILLQLLP